MQTIHHYHPEHAAYLGPGVAEASPLEPGIILLPAHATLQPPPATAAREVAQWHDGAWRVIPDWRGVPLTRTADGTATQIDYPGVVPADVGATEQPRPSPAHVWRDGAWVEDVALRGSHLETLRAAKQATINTACNAALAQLTAQYPEREINSWPQQEREARELAANPAVTTPLLSAIAAARELPVAELAARVLAKSDAFAVASGALIGRRQAREDALLAIDLAAPDAAARIAAIPWEGQA